MVLKGGDKMFGIKSMKIEFYEHMTKFYQKEIHNYIRLEVKHEIMIGDTYDFLKQIVDEPCSYGHYSYYLCNCIPCQAKKLRDDLLFVSQSQDKGGK
jgi:hypothetical protein